MEHPESIAFAWGGDFLCLSITWKADRPLPASGAMLCVPSVPFHKAKGAADQTLNRYLASCYYVQVLAGAEACQCFCLISQFACLLPPGGPKTRRSNLCPRSSIITNVYARARRVHIQNCLSFSQLLNLTATMSSSSSLTLPSSLTLRHTTQAHPLFPDSMEGTPALMHEKQRSSEEECRAHNPNAVRSKRTAASNRLFTFAPFRPMYFLYARELDQSPP